MTDRNIAAVEALLAGLDGAELARLDGAERARAVAALRALAVRVADLLAAARGPRTPAPVDAARPCRHYWCPTARDVQCCPNHSGFDVCCDRPELHDYAKGRWWECAQAVYWTFVDVAANDIWPNSDGEGLDRIHPKLLQAHQRGLDAALGVVLRVETNQAAADA